MAAGADLEAGAAMRWSAEAQSLVWTWSGKRREAHLSQGRE